MLKLQALFIASGVMYSLGNGSVDAQPQPKPEAPVEHELVIVANPGVKESDNHVDGTLSLVNNILSQAHYDWSMKCDVEFSRKGSVTGDKTVLSSGPIADIVASAKRFAPDVDVVIALAVQCGKTSQPSAGCDVLSSVPMVVTAIAPQYRDIVWLHERGHVMGLLHPNPEGVHEEDVPDKEISKRVMFWEVGPEHYGLKQAECDAFRDQNKLKALHHDVPLFSHQTRPNGSAVDPTPIAVHPDTPEKIAASYGLTVPAAAVIF